MSPGKAKTRLLRFVWGLIPWLFVGLLGLLVFGLVERIGQERLKLAEEKKAAIKQEVPAPKIIALEVKPQRLLDRINLPAVVEPHENLWVKAEVSGRVTKVRVSEGQMVKRGQVLVQLDDRDYVSRLSRIKANHEAAKSDYDRISALAQRKVMARADLDAIEAKLKDLTAQMTEAELALNRTKIITPISGQLNQLKAKEGNLLSIGQEVAQVLQFGNVKVTVGVPESDVAAVFDLTEADVIIDALGGRKVKGRKIFLARQPRTLARLYDLELAVDNPDGHILPGMFARVELVKHVFENALSVPLYAVITQSDDSFVFVVRDGAAHKRSVKMGVLDGWRVQILEGLEPHDKVVVVGHRLLEDGQAVEVLKTVADPKEIFRP